MIKKINLPGSKSITNRALLLAALSKGTSILSNVLTCDDTHAMVAALQSLGVQLTWDQIKSQIEVKGCVGQWPICNASIHVHDAGTVARFMVAASTTRAGQYHFNASARMSNRPMLPLLNVLSEQGIQITSLQTAFPLSLKVTAALIGGAIELDASASSQFASAIMMIAPFAQQSIYLTIKNSVSQPYLMMTKKMMQQFGVKIECNNTAQVYIENNQSYQANNYHIEPDASTASYFFAAAALMAKPIKINDLNRQQSLQGDLAFLNILETMGCQIIEEADGITVIGPRQLQGVEVNMQHCSDTFMTLAALAPFANSPTLIEGIGHTRQQESDRLTAMAMALTALNIKVEQGGDWLKIYPGTPQAAKINTHQDHRIAMSVAIIKLKVPDLIIENPEVVNKTFPEFFDYWQKLVDYQN